MGGAQLYTLRRARYLINNGVSVCIIVANHSNFILKEEFAGIPILMIKDIINPPSIVSIRKTQDILKRTKLFIGQNIDKNLIIESHHPTLSIWGELIASTLKCKHIIYFLSEPRLKSNSLRSFLDFFIWKWKRNELIGISNLSLKMIFENAYDSKYNNYVNVPFDICEILEITSPSFLNKVEKDAFVIGTISRLAKTYIETLILEVIRISAKHKNKKFYLIIGGDDSNKEILYNLKKKYEGKKNNLFILFPGYMNPIGKDFFERVDVFVGMGTAVVNSISQKCATITVDPRNENMASGIFGLTNNNFAYSESGNLFTIGELIELLLCDRNLLQKAQDMGFELFKNEYSVDVCMQKLDRLILSSPKDGKFWDVNLFNTLPVIIVIFYSRITSRVYLFLKSIIRKLKFL